MRHLLIKTASLAVALPMSMSMIGECKSQQDRSSPTSVVSAVVSLDGNGQGDPFFKKGSDAFLSKYFTRSFKTSWNHAMSQPEDVLDGDPITGSQALQSVRLEGTETRSRSGTSAVVDAKLAVKADGERPRRQTVTFFLLKEGELWKIDDITGPVDGTLRAYFRKSYGR